MLQPGAKGACQALPDLWSVEGQLDRQRDRLRDLAVCRPRQHLRGTGAFADVQGCSSGYVTQDDPRVAMSQVHSAGMQA